MVCELFMIINNASCRCFYFFLFLLFSFFPSFSLSLFSLQAPHESKSREALEQLKMSPYTTIYPHEESVVDEGFNNPTIDFDKGRRFLNVVNKDTPEFSPLQRLVKMIPFQSMVDNYVESFETQAQTRDKKRGNYQVNYGLCSGHSLTTAENIHHFGAAVPNIRDGTQAFLSTALVLEKIGRVMGMRICCPEYLEKHPELEEQVEFVREATGGMAFALVSKIFYLLDPVDPTETKRHCDAQNPAANDPLSEVLGVGQIVQDKLGR